MPTFEGKPTCAPTASATGSLTESIRSLAESTSDRLATVLADGDMDDWSRGEIALVARTYKSWAAACQRIVDKR